MRIEHFQAGDVFETDTYGQITIKDVSRALVQIELGSGRSFWLPQYELEADVVERIFEVAK
jgi:hypothetical protein